MRPLLSALVAAALLAGCASKHRQARRLEGRYDLGDPGQGWAAVDPGGADRAWYSEGWQATLYADSNCGARYDDRDLPALANAVAFGMATGQPLHQEERAVDGRDGLVRTVDGSLDGVAFRLGIAVLKKDACVYDLLLVAPRASFEQAWPGFEAALAGFRTRGS